MVHNQERNSRHFQCSNLLLKAYTLCSAFTEYCYGISESFVHKTEPVALGDIFLKKNDLSQTKMITRLTLLQGIRFSFCFFLLRNTVCLLLVKAGGCPEKWRSHGQKRKPFSESEWIVIPELLPVIHTCFFLCHVVCSAVILQLSTSTSTFHLITVPKLWLSLTACTFPSRRPATF